VATCLTPDGHAVLSAALHWNDEQKRPTTPPALNPQPVALDNSETLEGHLWLPVMSPDRKAIKTFERSGVAGMVPLA